MEDGTMKTQLKSCELHIRHVYRQSYTHARAYTQEAHKHAHTCIDTHTYAHTHTHTKSSKYANLPSAAFDHLAF